MGRNIRTRRLALGWTQEYLAEQLGVEMNTVSRMECGVHMPSLERLEALAGVIGLSLAELIGGASPNRLDQAERQAMFFRMRGGKA